MTPPKTGSARRWQRWQIVGAAEFFGLNESEILKGTKQSPPSAMAAERPAKQSARSEVVQEDDLNRVSVLARKLQRISPELKSYVDRHQVRDEVIAVLASTAGSYRAVDLSDEALAQIIRDAEEDLRQEYGEPARSGTPSARPSRAK